MIYIDVQMPTNCYDCWIRQNMGCRIANDSGWLNDRRDDKCPLKAQEPVAPVLQPGGNYVCGNCGMYTVGFMHPLTGESVQTWKYCGKCGKKVRWE